MPLVVAAETLMRVDRVARQDLALAGAADQDPLVAGRDPGGGAGADPGPACYGRGGTEPVEAESVARLFEDRAQSA